MTISGTGGPTVDPSWLGKGLRSAEVAEYPGVYRSCIDSHSRGAERRNEHELAAYIRRTATSSQS